MDIIVNVIQGIMDAGASVFLPIFITILGIVSTFIIVSILFL